MNLIELKNALTVAIEDLDRKPSHMAAFCAFMVPELAVANETHKNRIEQAGGAFQYGDAACLGFMFKFDHVPEDLTEAFREEVYNLSGKKYFSSAKAARFELDAIALLGVAIGMYWLSYTEDEKHWLTEILQTTLGKLNDDARSYGFAQAAMLILSGKDLNEIDDPLIKVSLMYSLGFAVSSEERQKAWENCVKVGVDDDAVSLCVKRAVFDHCAKALSCLPINGAGVRELVTVIGNVTKAMSHWTFETKPKTAASEARRWHVDHEYHVQNLLWTILKPVFTDLVDEEYLPKLAQKSSRFDLGVPSLEAIVEVKFMRRRGPAACRKLIDEVTSDHSLYLRPNTGYTKMIVFVWDDCRQIEHYDELIEGLESLKGIEKVVILPRPSNMIEG